MSALVIDNLTLAYGSRTVIHNFAATIEQGEFIGIFGPNGAGKSTLLRAILGLITPAAGTIQVLGKPARRGHVAIGYVPQAHSLPTTAIGQLSGTAHVLAASNSTRWGLPIIRKQQLQEVAWALSMVGAQDYATRPFAELSGGERQRLYLAQALLNHPQILLLDEPLANLDPHHQETFIDLVHHICSELKVTVLFTAHDLNPLLQVMNRIIYLARGNAAVGTVAEVVTNEKLSWLYGTAIEVIKHQQRLFVINQERGISADAEHHVSS